MWSTLARLGRELLFDGALEVLVRGQERGRLRSETSVHQEGRAAGNRVAARLVDEGVYAVAHRVAIDARIEAGPVESHVRRDPLEPGSVQRPSLPEQAIVKRPELSKLV